MEEGLDEPSSHKSMSEIFNEVCPYFMSIGMSYDEFWCGEADRVMYYRQAEKIRAERNDYTAWLNGLYFYEALCCVSPILNAFAKSGTKAHPYVEKPIHMLEKEKPKNDEEKMRQAADNFRHFVSLKNEKLREERGEINAD